MSDADIQWKNIRTLYYYRSPQSDRGYELRIGAWVVNGRELEPVLAKQEFETTVSGMTKWGKIKGLTKSDMYRIFEMGPLISKLMGFPMPAKYLLSSENDAISPAESSESVVG